MGASRPVERGATLRALVALAVALPWLPPLAWAETRPGSVSVVSAFERFGRETAAPGGRLDAIVAGRLLIGELGCVACHEAELPGLEPKPGPDLSGVGARVDATWLSRYLAEPATAAPGTTMPHALDAVPAGDRPATIAALVAHLSTRRAPVPLPKPTGLNPMPPAFWERGDAASGATLYHRVGCVACHAPEEGRSGVAPAATPFAQLDEEDLIEAGIPLPEKPFASVPLKHVAAKYSRRSLTEFLIVPSHARPAGRMPSLKLKAAEAADIAAYLLRDAGGDAPLPAAASRDDARTALGREAFVALRCVACHAGGVDGATVAPPGVGGREPPPLAQVDPSSVASCIAPVEDRSDGVSGPRYALDAVQRDAVVAALAALRRDAAGAGARDAGPAAGGSAASSALETTLLRLNCVACHERDGRGGVGTDRRAFFETVDHVDLGDEGRLPPRLTGVGARLQKPWLGKAVTGAVALRPFMRARMPEYPPQVVSPLPEAFTRADRATAVVSPRPVTFPPAGDAKPLVAAGAALLDAGCVQCHPLGERSLPGTVGVNLADVTKRVEPEWFRRLLLDPMTVRPGTKMPAFFGATVNRTILDGDPERQIAALWAYLDRPSLEPLPSRLASATGDFELVPRERPVLVRTFMEQAGTHAIAVGFPDGVHLAFDADRCRLAEAWRGRFIDARGTWVLAKSAPPADPLGTDRIVVDRMPPVAVAGSADEAQPASRVRFLGYALDRDGVPTFRYRCDASDGSADIADRLMPDVAGSPRGLVRRVTVRRPAGASSLPGGLVLRVLGGAAIEATTAVAGGGATATTADSSLTATLDAATAMRAAIRDGAWIVPLDADEVTVEVRYRW